MREARSGEEERAENRPSKLRADDGAYDKPRVVHAEQAESSAVGQQSGDDTTCSGVPKSETERDRDDEASGRRA